MDHKEYLSRALQILKERGQAYGGVEESFQRAALISSLKLNKDVSAYDVATILESVKDARLAENPDHWDSHVDGINYRAFRGEFSNADPVRLSQREKEARINEFAEDAVASVFGEQVKP